MLYFQLFRVNVCFSLAVTKSFLYFYISFKQQLKKYDHESKIRTRIERLTISFEKKFSKQYRISRNLLFN